MSLWKRLFWGSFSGALGVLIKTLVNLLIIPCLMALLGTANYGFYVLLVGFIEMSVMLDFGFSSALTTELGANLGDAAENRARIREYLSLGQLFYGALSILILLLGVWFTPWLMDSFHLSSAMRETGTLIFPITFVTCCIYLYSSYYRAVLLAHCSHQWTNTSDALNQIIGNALGLGMIVMGYGLAGFLGARLLTTLITALFLRFQGSKLEPDMLLNPVKPDFKALGKIFNLSFHAAFIQLSIIISHRIDMFVIGANLSLVAVSLYELIFRVLSVISQLISQICQGFFPVFARLNAENNPERIRQFFLKVSFLMNFLAALMFICVIPFFGELLALFSAKKVTWEQAAPILPFAIPIFWSAALQFPGAYYLFTSGHQKFSSITSILTSLFNLALSLLLVKPFGVIGVVLGTLIPLLIQHQLFNIGKSLQLLKIPVLDYIANVHLRLLPTVAVSLLFLYGVKSLFALMSPINLAVMMLTDLLTCGVAVLVGYFIAATEDEKQFLKQNVLTPLKLRLGRSPQNVAS